MILCSRLDQRAYLSPTLLTGASMPKLSKQRFVTLLAAIIIVTVTAGNFGGRSAAGANPDLTRSRSENPMNNHPYAGMWVTADGYIRHELLANGRYDEARGRRQSAYQGRYEVRGNHIDYWDDTGFTADGIFVQRMSCITPAWCSIASDRSISWTERHPGSAPAESTIGPCATPREWKCRVRLSKALSSTIPPPCARPHVSGSASLACRAGCAARSRTRRSGASAPALIRGCGRNLALLRELDAAASKTRAFIDFVAEASNANPSTRDLPGARVER